MAKPNFVALGAVVGALALAGAARVSATTFVNPVIFTTPATGLFGGILTTGNTYEYTFSVAGTYDALTNLSAAIRGATAEPISFSLFSNTGTTAVPILGTLEGSTIASLSPSIDPMLAAGNYVIRIDTIAVNGETASGSVTLNSGVPEPASWAMMLVGAFGLGAVMRTRRQRSIAAA